MIQPVEALSREEQRERDQWECVSIAGNHVYFVIAVIIQILIIDVSLQICVIVITIFITISPIIESYLQTHVLVRQSFPDIKNIVAIDSDVPEYFPCIGILCGSMLYRQPYMTSPDRGGQCTERAFTNLRHCYTCVIDALKVSIWMPIARVIRLSIRFTDASMLFLCCRPAATSQATSPSGS